MLDFFKKLFLWMFPKNVVSEIKTPSKPVVVPISRMQSVIPFAIQSKAKMPERGEYQGGYPWGAIVHFTAGTYAKGLQDAHDSISYGIENGYTYLCIARTGELVQAHNIMKHGYHAGESSWPGLGNGVSNLLIGIELCNAGKLEKTSDGKFKTWYGSYIDESDVRYVVEKDYECPAGFYHKLSAEQEQCLINTILWLKRNDQTGKFSFDFVLGHHECSGIKGIGRWRKNDIGGSLSMPMSQFRQLLKDKYEANPFHN